MTAAERLWWYARYFDGVEVNSTLCSPAVGTAKLRPSIHIVAKSFIAFLIRHHFPGNVRPLPPQRLHFRSGR